MSDSSLSSATPSQPALEQALRLAVQRVYKLGNLEELTVKRIRAAAEQDLDLEEGFFKSDSTWKEKSKDIIQSEVEFHADTKSAGEPLSQNSPKTKAPIIPPKAQTTRKSQAKGVKRASPADVRSRKRQKKADSDDESTAVDLDGAAPARPVAKVRKRASHSGSPTPERDSKDESGVDTAPNEDSRPIKTTTQDSDSEMSVMIDEKPKRKSKSRRSEPAKGDNKDESGVDTAPNENSKPIKTTTQDSDSEMSVLIDDQPKRKSKSRRSEPAKATSKKLGTSKATKGTDKSADPDAEEIKRLQGWLVKCGCRKMWYKELAPYDTPKLKIRHLKEMLSDIGMTGRYSIEKATQIREERELKADLEAVQEGEKHWGKDGSEEESTNKPRTRLARGLKELDFLNDDDGAETD